MNQLRIHILHPQAKAPVRQHDHDAGLDLISPVETSIPPGQRQTIPLGFAAEFSPDFVALFHDRSSLGARGIHCLAGVIDASYRGEWKIVLLNTTDEPFVIHIGDRIGQCLLQPVELAEVVVVDQLSDSSRGEGGFGSTGK